MAPIVIEKVLSVSSEDPNHPAENLLKNNYSGKKWKCKSPGEKQIAVILQLEKPSVISSIDVGNEHTAFLEVLVGKSTASEGDYKVLVVTSTLMGLQDSKYSSNANAVRFFKQEDLTKEVRDEKWDRVKVICSQPFNKHVQYGLCFIIFHTNVEKDNSNKPDTSATQFSIGVDSTSDKPSFTPGSLFARRKELAQDKPKAGAAAVRAAAATLDPSDLTFAQNNPKLALPSPKVDAKRKTADDTGSSSPKANSKRKTTNDAGTFIK